MFNSNKLSLEAHPPVLVHAFGANKFRLASSLRLLAEREWSLCLPRCWVAWTNRFYGNMLREFGFLGRQHSSQQEVGGTANHRRERLCACCGSEAPSC